MPESVPVPTFAPSVVYEDPFAAMDWLEKAFGFERSLVVTDDQGKIAHAEMSYGSGYITIAYRWADFTVPPSALGGANTQSLRVHLQEDVDAHFERARAAGATVLQGLADQFYGERNYRVRDYEGHVWTFGQPVKTPSITEMEEASGLKIRTGREA